MTETHGRHTGTQTHMSLSPKLSHQPPHSTSSGCHLRSSEGRKWNAVTLCCCSVLQFAAAPTNSQALSSAVANDVFRSLLLFSVSRHCKRLQKCLMPKQARRHLGVGGDNSGQRFVLKEKITGSSCTRSLFFSRKP